MNLTLAPALRVVLRPPLVILNKTHYRTRDIRRIILAALKTEGVSHLADYVITIGYTHGRELSGVASYHRPRITLRLHKWTTPAPHDIAALVIHEWYHTQGYGHRGSARPMPTNLLGASAWRSAARCYAHLDGLPLRRTKRGDAEVARRERRARR